MTGKLYYLATLGGWRRHSARFAHSHWVAVDAAGENLLGDASKIFVVVDADEGAHAALDDDAEFEALPHPLSHLPVSSAGRERLRNFGVTDGANTYDVAEAMARVHPLLRHRVF
jgi:hypothetical protein